MKPIASVAFTKIKYFCATQFFNFYAGVLIAVLGILSLSAYIPLYSSALFSLIITPIVYTLGRLTKEKIKNIKNIKYAQDMLAVILGNIWVLIFVFI